MSWGPGTTASRGKIALQMTRDVCVTFLDSLKNPLFHYQKKFLIRCKFSNEILLKLKSEMPSFNCSNWCWQQHGPHRPASIDLAVNPIRCNKLTKNWCPSNNRALVGGGAGGAIAPPTFLDLLNRYQFLPKNSNFFISTSTPKKCLATPSQNADKSSVRSTKVYTSIDFAYFSILLIFMQYQSM